MLTFDLSPLSFVQITGPDAAKFLQGQITADINEVTSTQSRLTAHCNAKGRIQFLGRLLKLNENCYLLILPAHMAEQALQSLKKYAVFSKVQLEIVTTWLATGILGVPAPELLTAFDLTVPAIIDQVTSSNKGYLVRVPGVDRFELLSLEQPTTKTNCSAWQCLDIQNGIPWVEPATINEFTPHQLNLPALNAVNFKKGCYTGQEIIARMQYLGKLKEALAYLTWEENDYPAGTACFDDNAKIIGTLICSAIDSQQMRHGLATLRLDHDRQQTIFIDQTKVQFRSSRTDDQPA